MATSPRLIEMVAVCSSKSSHRSPRSSLRRIPVKAAVHKAGKRRCPAAARRKLRSSSGVHERCSTLGIDRRRGVGDQGDVSRDEPAAHRLLQSPPDDQVDLVHRLRSERGVPVGRMEQPVVEGVEVVGTQAPQADVAESGDDVALDVVAVAVVGACSEDEAFAREPPAPQKGPQAQRARFVACSVPFAGQPRGKPLGAGTISAGGMPAPTLLPSDRVGALVDDRVPAAALLRHIALHRGSSFPDGGGRRPVEGSVEGRVVVA
jgi:hypothetical protein